MAARKVSGFFSEPTSGLSHLASEAKRLLALSHVWEAIAPVGLARFSRVGPLKDRNLTLYADNGAVAAKLKQQLPRLIVDFRQRGLEVNAIRVEVQVTGRLPKSEPIQRKEPIPAAGIASLEQLEHALEPSPLKYALAHLLEHQAQLKDENGTADGDQGQDD
jgi:hypothetical protein